MAKAKNDIINMIPASMFYTKNIGNKTVKIIKHVGVKALATMYNIIVDKVETLISPTNENDMHIAFGVYVSSKEKKSFAIGECNRFTLGETLVSVEDENGLRYVHPNEASDFIRSKYKIFTKDNITYSYYKNLNTIDGKYRASIAYNRGFDRAVLSLLDLHDFYSSSESIDFQEAETVEVEPPKEFNY